MKKLMCITTNAYDRAQYRDTDDLEQFFRGLGMDGLEAFLLDHEMEEILEPDMVVGFHLPFHNCWVDFWKGNEDRLLKEYDTWERVEQLFGGRTKERYIEKRKRELCTVNRYHPEYVVCHVSECTAYEAVFGEFQYSDREVIKAAAEYINSWIGELEGEPWLLLENLWHSGLTLQKPEIALELLESINYQRKGFLLDTGHLMHCNTEITTPDEGVEYILEILNRYPDPTVFRGIHLHQTLSGEVIRTQRRRKMDDTGSYEERQEKFFPMVYEVDAHRPFQSERIEEILSLAKPEYLVYELISSNRAEYQILVEEQNRYLKKRQ